MRTREQQYAAKVFDQITSQRADYLKSKQNRDEYGAMAHKLPILIRTAGLTQALAFVKTRGKEPHQKLLDDLATTLDHDTTSLLQRSREAELDEYMLLTRYALEALLWYKRYAQSILEVDATTEIGDAR